MIAKIPKGHFYGTTVRHIELDGIRLSETLYAPKLIIPPHFHELANFCFVLSGGYDELYGGSTRHCVPNTLIFHPAGEVHSDRHDTCDVRIFSVELDGPCLKLIQTYSFILDLPVDFCGSLETDLAKQLYMEFRRNDEFAPLAIEGLMFEIMATASRGAAVRSDRSRPIWLKVAEELLRESVGSKTSISTIAEIVGVHPGHLSRTFRKKNGCTTGEYLRRCRIEAAREYLRRSQLSISEVSLALGFADQSHFSRTFRQCTGVTPAQYRRSSVGG